MIRNRISIAVFVVLALLSGILPAGGCEKKVTVSEPKAVIVDQLYSMQPNPQFIENTTQLLNNCGFKVDYFKGDEITVDFLRRLADQSYRVMIFRAHAGLLGAEGKTVRKTCLFTNELYTETSHVGEQLSEKLAKARVNPESPWVFAVGADFVKQSMKGTFDRTMVIMMGCSTLYIDDLAKAFIEKGASVYTGFDLSVGLDFTDKATSVLMQELALQKASVVHAVENTYNRVGRDPNFGAIMKFYPFEGGGQTLIELSAVTK